MANSKVKIIPQVVTVEFDGEVLGDIERGEFGVDDPVFKVHDMELYIDQLEAILKEMKNYV